MLLLRTAPARPRLVGQRSLAAPALRRTTTLRTTTGRAPRVLHVSHMAAPHVGGLEAVVAAQTQGLVERGWQVDLLSSACGATPGTSRENDVTVTRVRAWNGLEGRGVPFPVFAPVRLLLAMLRSVRRSDVVHVHDPLYVSSWVAAFLCVLVGRPYVVHRHVAVVAHPSWVVRTVQRTVLGTMGRLVLRGASRVVAIDEPIAEWSRRTAPKAAPARVLANGVDHERFRPAVAGEREAIRADLGLPQDVALVLYVGRFVPKKGFDHVAAATGDDYRIVFAGGERPEGLDDERLVFLGALSPEQVARVYRCVDLFVVGSVGECPLTVLESRSSGLPVVVNADAALTSSPWTSGPGVWTCDVAAPGELAATLTRLLGDRAAVATAGAAAARHVGEGFGWGRHLDDLEEVYRGLVRVHAA
ncbi:glycosyltransferase family 4 protein [Nocardioides marmoraquaticus]